jgi:hypothetical protein
VLLSISGCFRVEVMELKYLKPTLPRRDSVNTRKEAVE